VTATAPNQVWTWDITKLATTSKGVFLMAYVIIDLFSRFVVGWMVATMECKHLAAQLFAETIARHGVEPGLQVHSDRGSAMKSDTLAQLLDSLGASRSFSRPRVSNDNPQAEAQFKTMKYQPDYPGLFTGPPMARSWLGDYFAWHNNDHHHAGLALFTPADVFHGRVSEVAAIRQVGRSPWTPRTRRTRCGSRTAPRGSRSRPWSWQSTPSPPRPSSSPRRALIRPWRPAWSRWPEPPPGRSPRDRQAPGPSVQPARTAARGGPWSTAPATPSPATREDRTVRAADLGLAPESNHDLLHTTVGSTTHSLDR
jgi:hypothetical protein